VPTETLRSSWRRLFAFLALCVVLMGILIQQVVTHGPLTSLDRPTERFAVAHRTGVLTDIMRFLSQIGSTSFLVPLVLLYITYFVFRQRDWRRPAVLAVALVSDILMQDLVKSVVDRNRPPARFMIGRYPPGSFPSGHTTQSLVVYGLIALLLIKTQPAWPRIWPLVAAASLVLLIGASRIYLGAHWLTDVAGGIVLGTFWIIILHALFPFLLRDRAASRAATEASSNALQSDNNKASI
jgi:membrane-associated phospholipid phosphatase